MKLGINLSFALKRWPEPERWAFMVRDDLGLDLVQFNFDLLDPWWPQPQRGTMAGRVRQAAQAFDLTIHSAQLGLAWYTYNGFLHPDPQGREVAREWWQRAAETAAEVGTPAIGGPLGALSVDEAADPATVERRYAELLENVILAAEAAGSAGLEALLVEPTPLPREIPHTIAQAERLANDLRDRTAVPLRWVLDVGHALYRPLYGQDVTLEDWLAALGPDVGVVHLQNHDYVSDMHAGWPDERGLVDVAAFGRTLQAAGMADVPVVIELFYPFEMDDADVLASVRSTVRHCREVLG